MRFSQLKYFNYVYFSGKININYIPEKSIIFTLFKTILKAFYLTFYLFKNFLLNNGSVSAKGRIVFFVMSSNNFLSLNPIYVQMDKKKVNLFTDRIFQKNITPFIPTILAAYIAVFFFPKLLYDYMHSDKIVKKYFKKGINDVILSYPFYYTCYFWIKIIRPKAIIISNDHVFSTRTLVYWANKFNIPSFYIQHASVTEAFPPLEVTYALLEGEDAKEKYIIAGSDPSKIELIGIPKLDSAFHKINNNTNIQTIGIAANGLEPKQLVFDLILFLAKNYPSVKLVYRPHRMQYFDSQNKKDLNDMFAKFPLNVLVSNPFEEAPIDYLSRIDCLIAGDSSIHLEAVLLNVTSIYFSKNSDYYDYYGYVKNKLIDKADTLEDIKVIIDNIKDKRPAVQYKATRYCNTIGTDYQGKSTELAIALLEKKIKNG
jgi:hypothetical protein